MTRKADLCNLSGFCDDKLKRSCCKRSTAFGRENKRRVGRALQGTKRAKFCAVQILHTAVAFLQSVYMQAACREIYLTPAQRDELAHTKTVPVSQALFCSSFSTLRKTEVGRPRSHSVKHRSRDTASAATFRYSVLLRGVVSTSAFSPRPAMRL